MGLAAPPLFDRLPPELFRPLAAGNNRQYWGLLCRLLDELWGDGGRSPGEEAPKSVVVRTIESLLVADDPWDEELETPINIRAHNVYNTFKDSGWLTQRRRGLLDTVTVRPLIAQFHTVLSDFAHQEPEYLGSKVRSIYLNLRAVAAGEAGGDAFSEAARQSKRCMAHIANTGCRVHDLMDELVSRTSAREFVKGFFEEYVEKLFIADYSEIRTKDHPLQHRTAIVATTLQFHHEEEKRSSIVGWYREKQAGGDQQKAEALYERDHRHLLRLRDVEDHLRRLDEEIRVANQRAMAFIEYKLRAPRNFDKLVARAISGANAVMEGHIALPAAAGFIHASEFGLARPRQAAKEVNPTRLESRPPTPEQLAMESLRKLMAQNRMVKPVNLAMYVARHIEGNKPISSDELAIDSINDLCCYQRLLLIASRAECPPKMRNNDPHLQMLKRVKIEFVRGERTRNDFMEHQKFVLRLEAA